MTSGSSRRAERASLAWSRRIFLGLAGTALVAAGLLIGMGVLAHGEKDWPVPEEAKKLKNLVPPSEAALEAAQAIYVEKCLQCHGDTGNGQGPQAMMYDVKPANFTDAHMMREMTDGEIFWKMSEGRAPMPAFKKQLTEEQRWQLVHYIRTFASPKAAGAKTGKSAPAKKTPGSKQ